jgi:WD40 repeat protein
VNDVAFDGRRARLVTAGADGVARIWSVESGKLLQELRGHKAAVTAAEFSRDGRLLATASADHDGRLWDASSGRPLAVLSGHFGRVSDIALNAGGRWAVTAGPASAALWETRTGRLVFYLRGHRGMVASADFADADDTAFTAGADGTVRTYRCDICGDLEELASLARDRLARTGRALSDDDRRRYLNGD